MGRSSDSISKENRINFVVVHIVFRFIKGCPVNGSLPTRLENLLRRTKVFFMKFEFVSKGVRNDLAHCPATVTELSWPSFAVDISIISGKVAEDPLMLGVMNIHCGSLLLFRSVSNIVKFLILARRSTLDVTES